MERSTFKKVALAHVGTWLVSIFLLIPVYALAQTDLQETLCKNIYNTYQCAQAIEAVQIKRYSNHISRSGKTLELKLEDGKVLKLRDQSESDNVGNIVLYSFRDYVHQLDLFLVENQYYEGGSFSLIDRKTGQKYLIDELPIFSSDYKRFVTVDACIGHCSDTLHIWKITKTKPIIEKVVNLSYEVKGYSMRISAKWIDNKKIEVKEEYLEGHQSESWLQKRMFFLQMSSSGWQILE